MTKTETIEAWIGVDADGFRFLYDKQPSWNKHRQFFAGGSDYACLWPLCRQIPVEPGTCQKVILTLSVKTDGEPVKGEA